MAPRRKASAPFFINEGERLYVRARHSISFSHTEFIQAYFVSSSSSWYMWLAIGRYQLGYEWLGALCFALLSYHLLISAPLRVFHLMLSQCYPASWIGDFIWIGRFRRFLASIGHRFLVPVRASFCTLFRSIIWPDIRCLDREEFKFL